jgi:peptidoglycan hydrolase CwlO-like protein
MKELIAVSASFLIVVALAFYMYTGNEKHTTAVIKNKELNEVVEKNYSELKAELESLKLHIAETDSIYHRKGE